MRELAFWNTCFLSTTKWEKIVYSSHFLSSQHPPVFYWNKHRAEVGLKTPITLANIVIVYSVSVNQSIKKAHVCADFLRLSDFPCAFHFLYMLIMQESKIDYVTEFGYGLQWTMNYSWTSNVLFDYSFFKFLELMSILAFTTYVIYTPFFAYTIVVLN